MSPGWTGEGWRRRSPPNAIEIASLFSLFSDLPQNLPQATREFLMLVCQDVSVNPAALFIRLRRAAALPIYTLALILDFASAALGRLAAWVASDDWPG